MKRITVILLAGALAGCENFTSFPQPPMQGNYQGQGTYQGQGAYPGQSSYQVQSAEQRAGKLKEVHSWNAAGALSIQQAPKQPMIMHYEWEQRGPNYYHVELASSLNLAAVSITGTPQRVTLQKGNQPPVSARTPEMLMQRNLGWSLPIPSLWYWARGLPAPGRNQGARYDQYGHLVFLQQNGWRATFSGYQTVQGVDLPGVIELQRGNIFARIVVKQWQINFAK
jgi:outer membrane lipoprotein LolB